MNSLGEMSEAGTGIPQNYWTARSWYQKAADVGHADAMGNLGALLERGLGGPQNLEMAREWYVKGTALNGRIAMHNLGLMFENGRGAAKDLAQAKFWYERAAALKYPPALNDLGRLYLMGLGVPKSYPLAKASFEQAANLGNAAAMNNLGMLYLNGRGVRRDISVARTWLEKSATLNDAQARDNLKRLDEAALVDGTQVAARRVSCLQTCANLQRSYVSSVCDHFSAIADSGKPERTRCIDMSLSAAKQCRNSCREWAPTPVAENKCVTCFQGFIACGISQQPPHNGDNEKAYSRSGGCLAAFDDCTASCRTETSNANRD